ncbi:exosome complex exonuclease RRP46 homolog [Phoenix dactylifera]|uniref:Exosome complex exonuclease RRP46 homolog n=1 Tax=Phoenix dactylifera TaxID=42345 RepID=A0A8B7MUU8_PHODC|nr:exosome complex exonuclease RRP46 homolog [Phoenix dactylifera]
MLLLNIYVKVAGDDGAILPCTINASCAALVDAGICLKHLSGAICCGLTDSGSVILDQTKAEEAKMQSFAYLVFPNSPLSILKHRHLWLMNLES